MIVPFATIIRWYTNLYLGLRVAIAIIDCIQRHLVVSVELNCFPKRGVLSCFKQGKKLLEKHSA